MLKIIFNGLFEPYSDFKQGSGSCSIKSILLGQPLTSSEQRSPDEVVVSLVL